LAAVVAIPARDEANRVAACLGALARQEFPGGTKLDRNAIGVVLLLNNCRDGTARIARGLAPQLPFHLAIEECQLPPELSHAGAARGLAMDAAADWLLGSGLRDGYLLTTDADTCVAPDWIARQVAAFDRGADAVAGLVIDDPAEHRRLPSSLRQRGRLEARYGWLLTELEAMLDPDPCDPWPRHGMTAGASLGVRLCWYQKVGGVPLQPAGEDRALVQRLQGAGACVRHCVQTRVVTSCRLQGRAPGGMADTMRQRIAEPDAVCDATLEPVSSAVERYLWRAALRRQHRIGRFGRSRSWASSLAIPARSIERIVSLQNFEAAWQAIEAESGHLRSRLLRPADLPAQIILAKQVLRTLRDAEAAWAGGSPGSERRRVSSLVAARVSLLPRHRGDTTGAEPMREAAEILA
jgi:hypothetical protein